MLNRMSRLSIITVVAVALIVLALCLFSEWSAGLAEVEGDELGCMEVKPDIDELQDVISYWDGYYHPYLLGIARRNSVGFERVGLIDEIREVQTMMPEMKWVVFQYELLCRE